MYKQTEHHHYHYYSYSYYYVFIGVIRSSGCGVGLHNPTAVIYPVGPLLDKQQYKILSE